MAFKRLALFVLLGTCQAGVYRPGRGGAAAWLLWDAPHEDYDPPFCASATAMMVNDVVAVAQDVIAITGDCMGDLLSPPDCAADIASMMADLLDAAQMAASMATACAGERTTCAQIGIDTPEMVMFIMMDLIGASQNCDTDAFLCTINCVAAVKDIFGFANDVDTAVAVCPKKYLRKWLKRHFDDWGGWDWVKRRLNAKLHGGNSTVGIVDLNDGGDVLAADHAGFIHVGSALTVPGNGRRLESGEARLLPSLHDADIDVWHVLDYPQKLTAAEFKMAYE